MIKYIERKKCERAHENTHITLRIDKIIQRMVVWKRKKIERLYLYSLWARQRAHGLGGENAKVVLVSESRLPPLADALTTTMAFFVYLREKIEEHLRSFFFQKKQTTGAKPIPKAYNLMCREQGKNEHIGSTEETKIECKNRFFSRRLVKCVHIDEKL